MEEALGGARQPVASNDTNAKQTSASVFTTLYMLFFIALSIWLGVRGMFNKPIRQLVHFFTTGTIDTADETFSWNNWKFVAGFIVLKIWASVLLFYIAWRIAKKPYVQAKKDDTRIVAFVYELAYVATIEELCFRWFPLGVLYPLFGATGAALRIFVVGSSVLFGHIHLDNQKAGHKNVIFLLPQTVGGFMYSYLFLAFGLRASLVVHFMFGLILLPLRIGAAFDKKQKSLHA